MKLGIIGAGGIVQEFLPKLRNIHGLEILGVQGTKRSKEKVEELCAKHEIAHAVDSFDALCALGIDTVYIAVPNHLHFTYCKQALEKGLHVIVEKPMTSNLKEALILKQLAEEKQLFLFEAITTLYLDNFHTIEKWLPRIGTVKLVQSQFSQYSRRYDAFLAGEVLPVFDPEKSGGAMMDLNLYNLHLIMGLFGKPEKIQYYANLEKGIDTNGMLIMQYEHFTALALAAKDSKGISGAVLQGTKGCIKTDSCANAIGKVTLELNDGTIEERESRNMSDRMIPEFEAFVQAISEGNLAFCYEMLDKSIAVCEVQTDARMSAGIIFPADR